MRKRGRIACQFFALFLHVKDEKVILDLFLVDIEFLFVQVFLEIIFLTIQVPIEKLNGKVLSLKVPKGEIVKAKYFCLNYFSNWHPL